MDCNKSYEAKIESLHKEAKGYLDSVRGISYGSCFDKDEAFIVS